jgi:ABC-type arginine/histidine transport system permease subunit
MPALAHNSGNVGIGGVFALLAAIIRIARPRAIAHFVRAFIFIIRH